MFKPAILTLLSLFIGSLFVSSVAADLVVIDVTADGTVDSGSFSPGVESESGTIATSRNFSVRVEMGIFEFDLSSIPTGATIVSAEFSGHTLQIVDSDFQVDFYGYTATNPATIQMSDAAAGSDLIGFFDENDLSDGSSFSLNISDISSLQNAYQTTGVFGIRSDITNQDTWWVASSESSFSSPTLTVNFSAVPEPSSLAFLGIAGICMVGRRRARKTNTKI